MAALKSELFTGMAEKLGIELKFSAATHATSHGQTERTNQIVEQMLRKFIHQYKHNWDEILPYLLFAMRNAQNESTKFTPAELVYGHRLRDLLHVQKNCWEDTDHVQNKMKISTVQFLQDLTNKIETALKAAQSNVTSAQEKMKYYYDRKSTERKLEAGDSVLILQPTSNDKLLAQWDGPHVITQCLENYNYLVRMRQSQRVTKLHANSLRTFFSDNPNKSDETVSTVFYEDSDDDQQESLNCPDTTPTGDNRDQQVTDQLSVAGCRYGRAQSDDESDRVGHTNDPTDVKFIIGEQLTSEQTTQMHTLLTEYLDVFDPNPGLTDLVTHHIQLMGEMPCWQASYPIPESMRNEVENELRRLEQNGIIEQDNETKFNSPLMVIRKQTGGLRLVNNFVKLNEKNRERKV